MADLTKIEWCDATLNLWWGCTKVSDAVIGPLRPCAQVFPVATEHVNIHPFCLHLWAPMQPESWPLPDFSMGSGSI